MSEADVSIEIEGATLSLGDLAGLGTDDFAEFRRVRLVTGFYVFKVDKATLGSIGDPGVPAAQFSYEVVSLMAGEFGTNPDQYMGIKQSHNINLNSEYVTLNEWVGLIKSFMADSGFQAHGTLQEILNNFVGHMFIAKIVRKQDRNDKDKWFSNIDVDNVQPLTDERRTELGL